MGYLYGLYFRADIAVIGLAVMGQNLILNMNDHGYVVCAYNRTPDKVTNFLENEAKSTNVRNNKNMSKRFLSSRKMAPIILRKISSKWMEFRTFLLQCKQNFTNFHLLFWSKIRPILIIRRHLVCKTVKKITKNAKSFLKVVGAKSLEDMVQKLKKPRKIMLMVKAGQAVDDFIQKLIPLLSKGDIIIDGGNSEHQDTTRRCKELEKKGLLYVGSGVSGGEEGARYGPSLMPGGHASAWPHIKEIFQVLF